MLRFLLRAAPAAALIGGLTAACGEAPAGAELVAAAPASRQALSAQDGQIVDASGRRVALQGLNWFGFNNGGTMVNGVWGGSPLAQDFATVVYRQQLLGFNAVRLPFSFKDLLGLTPQDFSAACTVPSAADVAASVAPPGSAPMRPVPPQVAPPRRGAGRCNDYLPNDTVWNRYKYVVQFYARNGFYVLVDNHFREDQTVLEEGTQAWAAKWAKLVGELAADPSVQGHLMVDVLNEPDNFGLQWQANGGKPGLGDLYLAAMDAISAVAPDVLFLLEGTGQSSIQANWGDGFATDPALVGKYGISDPTAFFRALVKRPYVRQVVLAPHVYGPAVTTNPKCTAGAALNDRLSNSFGYATKQGFCADGTCTRFPVAVGEFGSTLTDAGDVQTMSDLVKYLNNTGSGADGRHSAIPNWFWWSWNVNSGDTGGLVKDNWVDIQWAKVALLQQLGLGKAATAPVAATPAQPAPSTSTPAPAPASAPVPAPSAPATPAPARPVPPPAPPVTGPVPVTTQCTVDVQLSSQWDDGAKHLGVVNVTVANQGAAIAAPWSLLLSGGDFVAAPQVWNWQADTRAGSLVGQVTPPWAALGGGQSYQLGAVVQSTSGRFAPSAAALNGQPCALTVH